MKAANNNAKQISTRARRGPPHADRFSSIFFLSLHWVSTGKKTGFETWFPLFSKFFPTICSVRETNLASAFLCLAWVSWLFHPRLCRKFKNNESKSTSSFRPQQCTKFWPRKLYTAAYGFVSFCLFCFCSFFSSSTALTERRERQGEDRIHVWSAEDWENRKLEVLQERKRVQPRACQVTKVQRTVDFFFPLLRLPISSRSCLSVSFLLLLKLLIIMAMLFNRV